LLEGGHDQGFGAGFGWGRIIGGYVLGVMIPILT
jgi:hypothetical protein